MNHSFQEILTHFPLHKLALLTPIPQEPVYYERIYEQVPEEQLRSRSICIFNNSEEWSKLNEIESSLYIIQDVNLVAIIICSQEPITIKEEICSLFHECGLPVIQINDPLAPQLFEQREEEINPYRQLSEELNGFMEEGFVNIATKVSNFLNTPLVYVDEHNHVLWETGEEERLGQLKSWLMENDIQLLNVAHLKGTVETIPLKEQCSFKSYCIQVHGLPEQWLLVSDQLVEWQRQFIAKFAGLTSLYLQSQGQIKGIQEKWKDDFLYDLFYQKFESQKIMIKKGKALGWNLENPHHLLLVNVYPYEDCTDMEEHEEKIVTFLQEEGSDLVAIIHSAKFDGHIVLLVEDAKTRKRGERKKYITQIADQFEKKLSAKWGNIDFELGIGVWYENPTNLNKSYQEAKLALQFGKGWFNDRNVFHFDDLGVLNLLIHIHRGILADFSEKYLGLLLENDIEHSTEYLKTLQVYFQHRGKINEVSEELFIHPNTLRYRMKKIEEIMEIDLQDSEQFSNIMIAVKILSLLQAK